VSRVTSDGAAAPAAPAVALPRPAPRDPRTGLPTVAAAIDALRGVAQEQGAIEVLYLNFDRYAKVEEIYGWEKLDAVLDTTARELRQLLGATHLGDARLAVTFPGDDDFVLLRVPIGDRDADAQLTTALVQRLRDGLCECIERVHGTDIASLFDLYVGRVIAPFDPKVRLERLVFRAIRTAAANARNVEQRDRTLLLDELRETIRTRAVYVEYHPIVTATTRRIFGYEALARGRMRSLRRPEVMFEAAAEAGLIWELSRLCRERAIEGMRQFTHGELLFLNVDPHDFADPDFDERTLAVPDPHRVVIEITERTAIKDYPQFRERLRAFREHGYRFAVDDAGSGYAGLGSIANLEPDFIKLDISLINGIDSNFIKQDLVATLVRFANDQGAMVIAEGVELAPEYDMVRSLGVHLVQGFFLHRPEQLQDEGGRPAGSAELG